MEFKASTKARDHLSPPSCSVLSELTLLGTYCMPGAGLSTFLVMNRWPLSRMRGALRTEFQGEATPPPPLQGEIIMAHLRASRKRCIWGNQGAGNHSSQPDTHGLIPQKALPPSPIFLHPLQASLFIKALHYHSFLLCILY